MSCWNTWPIAYHQHRVAVSIMMALARSTKSLVEGGTRGSPRGRGGRRGHGPGGEAPMRNDACAIFASIAAQKPKGYAHKPDANGPRANAHALCASALRWILLETRSVSTGTATNKTSTDAQNAKFSRLKRLKGAYHSHVPSPWRSEERHFLPQTLDTVSSVRRKQKNVVAVP